MPALDIAQIRAEAAELARLYGDPETFAAAAKDFFQAHSAPSYRQSLVVSIHAPLKSYDTPLPVLRALVNAVRKVATVNDSHTLLVAARLWALERRAQLDDYRGRGLTIVDWDGVGSLDVPLATLRRPRLRRAMAR